MGSLGTAPDACKMSSRPWNGLKNSRILFKSGNNGFAPLSAPTQEVVNTAVFKTRVSIKPRTSPMKIHNGKKTNQGTSVLNQWRQRSCNSNMPRMQTPYRHNKKRVQDKE